MTHRYLSNRARTLRQFVGASALAALALGWPPQALAQSLGDSVARCGSADPDIRIAGCGAVIQSKDATADAVADSLYSRAVAYNLKGLYDLAIADLGAYIAARPRIPDGYSERAYDYAKLGRFALAIADDSTAIGLDPRDADAYNNRAWDYHLNGEDAKGLDDADKAVALAPKDANAIETPAEINEKLGRRGDAIADYSAALQLDPKDTSARDGLKRLGATS